MILQMGSQAGLSRIILGRPATDSTELLQVHSGMLAHGYLVMKRPLSREGQGWQSRIGCSLE